MSWFERITHMGRRLRAPYIRTVLDIILSHPSDESATLGSSRSLDCPMPDSTQVFVQLLDAVVDERGDFTPLTSLWKTLGRQKGCLEGCAMISHKLVPARSNG